MRENKVVSTRLFSVTKIASRRNISMVWKWVYVGSSFANGIQQSMVEWKLFLTNIFERIHYLVK